MSLIKNPVRWLTVLAATCLTALMLTTPVSGRAAPPVAPEEATGPEGTGRQKTEATADDKQPLPSRKLAVIIDDLGNRMGGTDEVLNLPVKLTVAVMPFWNDAGRCAAGA
ncbi:hypothetical protein HMSSN139_37070 [Paenibacillus sp. HMSSN-139]|nr:hypothetical protein HMSSN139_37070 [Paenibacillus sp. HMSSN-139]